MGGKGVGPLTCCAGGVAPHRTAVPSTRKGEASPALSSLARNRAYFITSQDSKTFVSGGPARSGINPPQISMITACAASADSALS